MVIGRKAARAQRAHHQVGLALARDLHVLAHRPGQLDDRRQVRQFGLVRVLPVAQGAVDLLDGRFGMDCANHNHHHVARAIMALVELDQVLPGDRLYGLGVTIFRAPVRVTGIDDLLEGHRSHLGGVLRPDRQSSQELGAQPLHLIGGESRLLQDFFEQVQQQGQVFDQGAAVETGRACPAAKSQAGPGRFEGIIDLLEAALAGAAHQGCGGEVGQPQLFVRFEQAASSDVAGNNHRRTVGVRACQDRYAIGEGNPGNVIRAGQALDRSRGKWFHPWLLPSPSGI